VQYRCRSLAAHHTDLYGIWPRVANRSQIRPAQYGHVPCTTACHTTILVSLPNRVPCSTGVAASACTVPTCTESGRARQTVAKSDWDCTDAYCAVLLVTVRYRYSRLTTYCVVPVSPPRRALYRPVRKLAARSDPKPYQAGFVRTRTAQYRSTQCDTGTATRPQTVPAHTHIGIGSSFDDVAPSCIELLLTCCAVRFPRQAANHTGVNSPHPPADTFLGLQPLYWYYSVRLGIAAIGRIADGNWSKSTSPYSIG